MINFIINLLLIIDFVYFFCYYVCSEANLHIIKRICLKWYSDVFLPFWEHLKSTLVEIRCVFYLNNNFITITNKSSIIVK